MNWADPTAIDNGMRGGDRTDCRSCFVVAGCRSQWSDIVLFPGGKRSDRSRLGVVNIEANKSVLRRLVENLLSCGDHRPVNSIRPGCYHHLQRGSLLAGICVRGASDSSVSTLAGGTSAADPRGIRCTRR